MRISDWSSDVCSSDLPRLLKELISVGLFAAAVIATIILVLGHSMSGALAGSGIVVAIIGFALRHVIGDERGRASCRERVGEYVYMSVVASTLKTNQHHTQKSTP